MKSLTFRGANSRRVYALLCLALFLTLQLFGASNSLHEKIHKDANQPNHHCVITLFSQGQVNASFAPVVVPVAIASFCFLLPLLAAVLVSSFGYRFSFSRAPPRF